jgi:alginate O-acetyltransferase complex protein AlgI
MTFTSYQFIFGFLPLAFVGFAMANRFGGAKQAINFLAVVSLVFYGIVNIKLLGVLLGSLIVNFFAGHLITRALNAPKKAKLLMFGAIAANLLMLGYLKYTNFLIDVANQLTGGGIPHLNLIVPLGVSFFTFVQIGYLIDAYNGQLRKLWAIRSVLGLLSLRHGGAACVAKRNDGAA